MRKIFIFWIGDLNKISANVKKLRKLGCEVEIGPSKEEDKFLSDNYEYYKLSKKDKKYSFCSDVWRNYKLDKENGMYLDTSVEIGDDFCELYDYASKFNVWIPRVGYTSIAAAIMSRNGKTNYFKGILELFNENKNYGESMINWIGPHLQDFYAFKNGHFDVLKPERFIFEEICYDTIFKITDSKTIYKVGSGSWFDTELKDPRYFWKNSRELWNKKNPTKNEVEKSMRKNNSLPVINFYSLKNLYETRTKECLKELIASYRKAKMDSKPKFKELLIWSKLYRFFTGKWLKTK